jgi:predicted DNA-binding ribbon-helix-helix protein
MINIRGELKFFDILEEVKKEEQTTIETLLAWRKEECVYTNWFRRDNNNQKKHFHRRKRLWREESK